MFLKVIKKDLKANLWNWHKMSQIINASQLVAELKRIEQSPESGDLELLTIMLTDVTSSLVGLRPQQLGFMQADPQFMEAEAIWRRLHDGLRYELESRDCPIPTDESLPRYLLGPAYQKIYGT